MELKLFSSTLAIGADVWAHALGESPGVREHWIGGADAEVCRSIVVIDGLDMWHGRLFQLLHRAIALKVSAPAGLGLVSAVLPVKIRLLIHGCFAFTKSVVRSFVWFRK